MTIKMSKIEASASEGFRHVETEVQILIRD